MKIAEHLTSQYQLLTHWYISVLEDIKDEEGNKSLYDGSNSLEWLAGHLNVGRYRNMMRLGVQVEPYKHLEKYINPSIPPPNAIAFNKSTQYPALTESRQSWISLSQIFLDKLQTVDESVLKKELPFSVPTGNTIENALVFVALHESYHIGQMSLIRRSLGYAGMKFNMRPDLMADFAGK